MTSKLALVPLPLVNTQNCDGYIEVMQLHCVVMDTGILGKVLLGDTEVTDWKIYSLEFEPEFIQQ